MRLLQESSYHFNHNVDDIEQWQYTRSIQIVCYTFKPLDAIQRYEAFHWPSFSRINKDKHYNLNPRFKITGSNLLEQQLEEYHCII